MSFHYIDINHHRFKDDLQGIPMHNPLIYEPLRDYTKAWNQQTDRFIKQKQDDISLVDHFKSMLKTASEEPVSKLPLAKPENTALAPINNQTNQGPKQQQPHIRSDFSQFKLQETPFNNGDQDFDLSQPNEDLEHIPLVMV